MLDNDKNELFFYAAEGSVQDLERALKRHKDGINHRDNRGRTPLIYSAIADNLKNLQALTRKGANVYDVDNNDATVLHWATQCGSIKVIRHLLQLGKHPSTGRSFFLVEDKDGVTPMHIAATKISSKILMMFIDCLSPTDNVYEIARDNRMRSPLHYAASKASLDGVEAILNSTNLGLPIDQRDQYGLTALMCAAGVVLPQAVEVCRVLARRKMVSVSHRNMDGQTALHIAVAANNLSVVQLLAEELATAVEVFDNETRTPLHYAAEQGCVEIVKVLLKKGARNSTRDKYGVTPAHYAAQFSVECLDIILRESNINEVKDNESRSCLMWAVCAGNIDVIHHLVGKTVPSRQDRDVYGFTALHLAAMTGNSSICKLLIDQGWSFSERDICNNTPSHLAAGRGHTDVVFTLLVAGAAMDDVDNMGRTPVFWACLGGQTHTLYCMIKELVFEWRTVDRSSNDRVPITDQLGRTPLHAAAYAGFAACINVLLDIEEEDACCLKTPLVAWKDHAGETALHVACQQGRMDCAAALVKKGAVVNALDKNNNTPLQYAINNKHDTIIHFLRDSQQGGLTYEELQAIAANVVKRFVGACALRNKMKKRIQAREPQR